MTVWTISAQVGTGGAAVAERLALAADVPFLDRKALARFAGERSLDVEETDDLEQRVGGWLSGMALSMATTAGSTEALRELQLRRTLPEVGSAILAEAAGRPCVILASAAFAALPRHPSAVHVRLWAPLDWRVGAYRREHLADRHCSEKAVKHDDHVRRTWVKTLYHVDIDDARHYSIVLDASRLSAERIVETLLVAGGVAAAVALPG